ncbi:MAG TPA: right-handed parallel beta-helix repeat-containing protein [Blastocatellia bacterium]|nr:right-handed parallel beta-helix repeat-containing protein [Blastocatellia bacterium]
MSDLGLQSAGKSDRGQVRETNEDRLYEDATEGIFIVIDGMGGAAAGEVAASIALEKSLARLQRCVGSTEERICEAITIANNEIFNLAKANPEWTGMGCVMTVAIVEEGYVDVGHVGDTRLYRIQGGRIEKVTHDHSPVGEREDAGELSEIAAISHPRRNEVCRDVGSQYHEPDDLYFIEFNRVRFDSNAALLLCSDGLSDAITSAQMLRIIERFGDDPQAVVEQLILAANQSGIEDNVTAIFVAGRDFAAGAAGESVDSRAGGHWQKRLISPRVLLWASLNLVGFIGLLVLQFNLYQRDPQGESSQPRPRKIIVGAHQQADYPTIGAALAVARPGDVVEVEAGNYGEQIELKSSVLLISQEPQKAVLYSTTPDFTAPSIVSAREIENAQFAGFKILSDNQTPAAIGISVLDADLYIEDVEVTGTLLAGIEIAGSGSVTLKSSYIHDNRASGVIVRGDGNHRIIKNAIVGNGRAGPRLAPGIEVITPANPEIVGNLFGDNSGAGILWVGATTANALERANFFGDDLKPNQQGAIMVSRNPASSSSARPAPNRPGRDAPDRAQNSHVVSDALTWPARRSPR